jgi:hypothetical protein
VSSRLYGICLAIVVLLAGCGDDTEPAGDADRPDATMGELGIELVEYRRADDWTSPTNEICVVLRADPAVTADSVTLLGVELGTAVTIGPEGTTLCARRCWSFSSGDTDELVITRGEEMQVIDIADGRHCG